MIGIQELKVLTDAINDALRPEMIAAEFTPDTLHEYAADVGLMFDGKVMISDDGTKAAEFKRVAHGGMLYQVSLMVPPCGSKVLAYVLGESAEIQRGSVIGALDAVGVKLDSLAAPL